MCIRDRSKQPAQLEEQPEIPTPTGDINVPEKEMEKCGTGRFTPRTRKNKYQPGGSWPTTEQGAKPRPGYRAVSYTHLDVYKRQWKYYTTYQKVEN